MIQRRSPRRRPNTPITPELVQQMRILKDAGQTYEAIGMALQVAQSTVSRYLKEERENHEHKIRG